MRGTCTTVDCIPVRAHSLGVDGVMLVMTNEEAQKDVMGSEA
jgi:hypothetical protein